jgi:hypothetical protein
VPHLPSPCEIEISLSKSFYLPPQGDLLFRIFRKEDIFRSQDRAFFVEGLWTVDSRRELAKTGILQLEWAEFEQPRECRDGQNPPARKFQCIPGEMRVPE